MIPLTRNEAFTETWTLKVTVLYEGVNGVPLGTSVTTVPATCIVDIASNTPNVTLIEPTGSLTDFFYLQDNLLYPIRPISDFSVTCGTVETQYTAVWGTPDVNIVAGVPVNLQPTGITYLTHVRTSVTQA